MTPLDRLRPEQHGVLEMLLAAWPGFASPLAEALESAVTARGHGVLQVPDDRDEPFGFDRDVHRFLRRMFNTLLLVSHPDATRAAARLSLFPSMFDVSYAVTEPQHERALDALAIVTHRPGDEVDRLLQDPVGLRLEDPELGLLIHHELCGIGRPLNSSRSWFERWGRQCQHPLRHLPTGLLPIEHLLPDQALELAIDPLTKDHLVHSGLFSSRTDQPGAGGGDEARARPSPPLGPRVDVDAEAVGAPFREWIDHSNGQLDVRAYHRVGEAQAESHAPPAEPDVVPIEPAEGFATLFSCVGRGAYTAPVSGSYARLRVWESIAGITGLPWPTSVDRLADAATRASWFQVLSPSPRIWNVRLLIETDDRLVTIWAADVD